MVKRNAEMTEAPTGMTAHAGSALMGESLEPIAGVSLELYTEIAKGLAAYSYDEAKGPVVAAGKGVSQDSWEKAQAGWQARIRADRTIAKRFNALYTGRA